MKREPVLTFKISRPTKFHCSACRDTGDEGAFSIDTKVSDLIEAFKDHVQRYHDKGEDFNQAAFRSVQETIKHSGE